MTIDDLPQVRKLNNKYAEAVGECSAKMYQYLFSIAQHALVVKDQEMLVGFLLTVGEGSDYRSTNYKFHSEQGYDKWIYMDRIIVDEGYQSMSIGSKLYTFLID
jgi:predicted GNAT superfamily acetyltransferase